MEANTHRRIDSTKKRRRRECERDRGKNAIHLVFVLFFFFSLLYSRKGDDGHLFFSTRMGTEEEKIAKKEMFMASIFTRMSMHARLHLITVV